MALGFTRKFPLRGHILAPAEVLRAPELPGVNPGGRHWKSGGDSKAIQAKKKSCDARTYGRTYDGRTDRRDCWNSDLDVVSMD